MQRIHINIYTYVTLYSLSENFQVPMLSKQKKIFKKSHVIVVFILCTEKIWLLILNSKISWSLKKRRSNALNSVSLKWCKSSGVLEGIRPYICVHKLSIIKWDWPPQEYVKCPKTKKSLLQVQRLSELKKGDSFKYMKCKRWQSLECSKRFNDVALRDNWWLESPKTFYALRNAISVAVVPSAPVVIVRFVGFSRVVLLYIYTFVFVGFRSPLIIISQL